LMCDNGTMAMGKKEMVSDVQPSRMNPNS